MKVVLVLLAALAFWDNSVSAACDGLCGAGFIVGSPLAFVALGQNNFTCAQWDGFALGGQIADEQCDQVAALVFEPCGCVDAPPPTDSPTFGPLPDCFTDLDNIRERERTSNGDQIAVLREYVLCPHTRFRLGRTNEFGQIVDGFIAIAPRPNVVYKCGQDGSSANNCTIYDGEFAIASAQGDRVHSNVLLQGLTIEKSFLGGGIFARPGDITFVDCIFKNHQNLGPIFSIYPSNIRRELEIGGDSKYDATVMEAALAHSWKEGELDLSFEESDRHLQAVTTLTLTFRQCIFEDNLASPIGPNTRPGLITIDKPENILIVEDTIFRNNDYSDPTLSVTRSWAMSTPGPLIVKNSCLLDNKFVYQGPVLSTNSPNITLKDNFVRRNESLADLACEFVADFPNLDALNMLVNFTCIDADATECLADIYEPPTVAPTPAPTPVPLPESTPAPADDSMTPGTPAPDTPTDDSSVNGKSFIVVLLAAVAGVVCVL